MSGEAPVPRTFHPESPPEASLNLARRTGSCDHTTSVEIRTLKKRNPATVESKALLHFNKSPPSTNGISEMAEKHAAFAIPDSLATDEDLIALVSRGDIEAFERLVQRHQKSALRAAQRFLGDPVEAEDLAQDAFLQVYHQAHRYRAERAAFKTWFFTILLNLCRNAIKKKRLVYSDNPSSDARDRDDPSTLLSRQEQARALAEAILKLPPNQRSAFILCHYENFSYAEAAQSLGVSLKAIESLLVRAKRTLRDELAWLKKP